MQNENNIGLRGIQPTNDAGSSKAETAQDALNRQTLNSALKELIGGDAPDDATLDLLLEYPDIAKEWLKQAVAQIHEFICGCIDSFPCCRYETPRTLDWCEENCVRYYSCDTAAAAIDEGARMELTARQIEVNTIFGTLFAGVSGDPKYPGIHICIEQEENGEKYDKQLALAECTPNMPRDGEHSLRLLAWNSDHEDFTDDFTFIEGSPEPEETIATDPAQGAENNNMLYSAATYGDFFKIYEKGISVELSFNGFGYTGYTQFFDDHPQFSELKTRFANGQSLPVNTPLTVIGWGIHCHEATVVYVLEDPATSLIYLCGADFARYVKVLSHKAKYATKEDAGNLCQK